nr:sialate O-acetylesterase [uncultured Roseateles sp.]
MVLLVVLLVIALAAGGRHFYRQHRQNLQLEAQLARIVPLRSEPRAACDDWARRKPLVLLALGQSNAGNHGSRFRSDDEPVMLVSGADCVMAQDPLPGATGEGGSIWRGLPALLSPALGGRPVVLSVLAVDATRIDDWTRPEGALAKRLSQQIKSMVQLGLKPDLVLWQQGEADARIDAPPEAYLHELMRLASLLDGAGTDAPIMLARSTLCRSPPHPGIRRALEQAVTLDPRFLAGPDTDTLLGEANRSDGCHLSAGGLKRAAQAWAGLIQVHARGTAP